MDRVIERQPQLTPVVDGHRAGGKEGGGWDRGGPTVEPPARSDSRVGAGSKRSSARGGTPRGNRRAGAHLTFPSPRHGLESPCHVARAFPPVRLPRFSTNRDAPRAAILESQPLGLFRERPPPSCRPFAAPSPISFPLHRRRAPRCLRHAGRPRPGPRPTRRARAHPPHPDPRDRRSRRHGFGRKPDPQKTHTTTAPPNPNAGTTRPPTRTRSAACHRTRRARPKRRRQNPLRRLHRRHVRRRAFATPGLGILDPVLRGAALRPAHPRRHPPRPRLPRGRRPRAPPRPQPARFPPPDPLNGRASPAASARSSKRPPSPRSDRETPSPNPAPGSCVRASSPTGVIAKNRPPGRAHGKRAGR